MWPLFFLHVLLNARPTSNQNNSISTVDGRSLYNILFSSFDQAVGYSKFFSYVNKHVSVEKQPVHGEELLEKYKGNLESQIKSAVETVVKTAEFIEKEVEFGSFRKNYKRCGSERYHDSYFNPLTRRRSNPAEICYYIPRTVKGDIHFPSSKLIEVFKTNLQKSPALQQYLITEEGGMFNYPAHDLPYKANYDARLRPYYSHSSNLFYRDVVIVIDMSTTAQTTHLGKLTYKQAILQTLMYIIDSLNVKDRLTIIASSKIIKCKDASLESCCVFSEFAPASERLKKFLPQLFEELVEPDTSTEYVPLIQRGFDRLDAFTAADRFKCILFITAASPEDKQRTLAVIQEEASRWNSKNLPPVLNIYQIGNDPKVNLDLTDIAGVYISANTNMFVLKTEANLSMAGFFYRELKQKNVETRLTAIYTDTHADRGTVVTITQPIYNPNSRALLGVLANDIFFSDLVVQISPSSISQEAYIFLFDRENNNTFLHPFLPPPTQGVLPTAYVDIKLLVAGAQASALQQAVIDKLYTGQSGSLEILVSKQTLLQQKVGISGETTRMHVVYYYTPLDVGTIKLSLCLVLPTNTSVYMFRHDGATSNASKIFHNYEASQIAVNFPDHCQFFYTRGEDDSLRTFLAKRSYLNPLEFVNSPQDDSEAYEMVAQGYKENNIFVDGVMNHIELTNIFEQWWLSESIKWPNVTYVLRRLVASNLGLVRMHPNTLQLPDKQYDETSSLFYIKTQIHPDRLILSVPHRGDFGEGYIVRIGQAISLNSSNDTIFGFQAMDVPVHFVQELVEAGFEFCRNAPSSCFLVDTFGYVISHSSWLYGNWKKRGKVEDAIITEVEPEVGNIMLLKKQLLWRSCYDIYELKHVLSLEMAVSGTIENDEEGFRVIPIPQTNIFLVEIYNLDYLHRTSLRCSCITPECTPLSRSCNCPCLDLPLYNPCELTFDNESWLLCYNRLHFEQGLFDLHSINTIATDLVSKDYCVNYECDEFSSRSTCHNRSHCRWCQYTPAGKELFQPFCGWFHNCWFGQNGSKTIYPELFLVYLVEPFALLGELVFEFIAIGFFFVLSGAFLMHLNRRALKAKFAAEHLEHGNSIVKLPSIFITDSEGDRHRLMAKRTFFQESRPPLSSEMVKAAEDTRFTGEVSRVCYVSVDGKLFPASCDDPKVSVRTTVEVAKTDEEMSLSASTLLTESAGDLTSKASEESVVLSYHSFKTASAESLPAGLIVRDGEYHLHQEQHSGTELDSVMEHMKRHAKYQSSDADQKDSQSVGHDSLLSQLHGIALKDVKPKELMAPARLSPSLDKLFSKPGHVHHHQHHQHQHHAAQPPDLDRIDHMTPTQTATIGHADGVKGVPKSDSRTSTTSKQSTLSVGSRKSKPTVSHSKENPKTDS